MRTLKIPLKDIRRGYKKILLYATKYIKLWRLLIDEIRKRHGTKKNKA